MVYTIKKAYDRAVEEFDWAKVSKVMKYLNWTWGTDTEPPTINEMKATVKILIQDAVECAFCSDSDEGSAGTGGFEVHVERYTDDNGDRQAYVRIMFLLEEVPADSEDD